MFEHVKKHHSDNEKTRPAVDSELIRAYETSSNTKGVVSVESFTSTVFLSNVLYAGCQSVNTKPRFEPHIKSTYIYPVNEFVMT